MVRLCGWTTICPRNQICLKLGVSGRFLDSSELEDIDSIKRDVEGMKLDIVSCFIESGLIVRFGHL